ncbi:MAG: filamentous hemagglutinin N-terminal domain-containing protein [Methylococcaceae bacterium]
MSSRSQTLSWQPIWGHFLIGAVAFTHPAWADVTGAIVTDGSMGAALTLNGANVTVAQSLGTTAGNNLFHSFTEFNIAHGQIVRFTGSNALQNVISRVTGTDVTEIEGTLRSGIANAAFYFINPNGITFGTGAQVDVPGAFHVSTADKIDFINNGGVFYADPNQAGTLSSEAPAAFGFLETSIANNGLIEVNNSQLSVRTGQTLDMVAGGITVENRALVAAPAGEVRLVAMRGAGSVDLEQSADGTLSLPAAAPSTANAGRIVVNASAVDATGDGGGRIALWGGRTSLTNSTGYDDNSGTANATAAKGVDIRAYSLTVDNSWISFDALAGGNAGNVTMEAMDAMVIDKGGHIKSSAFGFGNAGNVILKAGTLDIFNGGNVSSSTYAEGNSGTVTVTADTLKIDSQGYAQAATGIVSRANPGSNGQAGNVTVRAGKLDVLNGGRISSSTFTQGDAGNVTVTADTLMIDGQGYAGATSIFSKAELDSSGQAGNVTVQAGELNILNAGDISSSTDAQGKAGNVSIRAAILNIFNGGVVSSFTSAQGNAGNVEVNAEALTIDSQDNASTSTGIYSRTNQGSSGRAGNVRVQAVTFDILNGGNVSSSTFAQGNAGNVTVMANILKIDSQGNEFRATGINSQANRGRGHAGNVAIQAGTLDILNGGVISSSTFAEGDAGDVTVNADHLNIDSQDNVLTATGIVSRANRGSSGHAGNVGVRAANFDILNGGVVSSSTFAEGDAGSVTVNADHLKIDSQGNLSTATGIVSRANRGSSGQAGNVSVRAANFDILNGGVVSSSTFAEGDAGSVTVNTDHLNIDSQGNSAAATGIFSEAKQDSGGQVGNVAVQAIKAIKLSNDGRISIENTGNAHDPTTVIPGSLTVSAPAIELDGGIITAATSGNVNAGSVKVTATQSLSEKNASTINSSASGAGSAGSVTVEAPVISLDNSAISAEATAGSGGRTGDVTVQAASLISLSNNGKISIENAGNALDPALVTPGAITVSAADIDMKGSNITTNSTGNVSAGRVNVNFSHWLTMDPSFIRTTANTGNGGTIMIGGGELIFLQNSGFMTTVGGADSNGGDISVTADTLLIDTGIIQANAVGGSGGNIALNLDALIPSSNMLILGGAPVNWQAFRSGFNVIQAASQAGVSGTVSVTAPQLNLSGIIANLGGPQFDTTIISQDYCGLGVGSALTRKGNGGLKPKSGDQLLF